MFFFIIAFVVALIGVVILTEKGKKQNETPRIVKGWRRSPEFFNEISKFHIGAIVLLVLFLLIKLLLYVFD